MFLHIQCMQNHYYLDCYVAYCIYTSNITINHTNLHCQKLRILHFCIVKRCKKNIRKIEDLLAKTFNKYSPTQLVEMAQTFEILKKIVSAGFLYTWKIRSCMCNVRECIIVFHDGKIQTYQGHKIFYKEQRLQFIYLSSYTKRIFKMTVLWKLTNPCWKI